MADRTVEHFPQRYARIGGALYLAIIVLGAFRLLVKGVNVAKWKERNPRSFI
jgi:hypothetical protein